jgi:hypothetical protein
MNTTPKNSGAAPVISRIAVRTARAPRFVCSATSRAVLPAAMGNRAFIRAWAAQRAARILK